MSRVRVAGATAVAALLLALFYPTLRWLTGEWVGNDYYSHGPLVPLISGFLAWRLFRSWPAPQRHARPHALGLVLSITGGALYVGSVLQRAYFLAALAMIILLAGLLWYLLGSAWLRRFAFPLLFLAFMIPLPFVEPLSVPLAKATGDVSAVFVRALGIPVTVQGGQVSLPNAQLTVGAQCSGLRSMVTLLTLVGLVLFLFAGGWLGKVVLGLSSVVIAAFGNIIRISTLLGVANRWGADAGFKYYHDYSGFVFFFSALALLLAVGWLLGCREIREDIF